MNNQSQNTETTFLAVGDVHGHWDRVIKAIESLKLDTVITRFLQARVDEVQACPGDEVPLGTNLLLGSTLELVPLSFRYLVGPYQLY